MSSEPGTVSRRDVLSLIGAVSGSAAMYHAMTSLGFAADSGYKGPIKLDGDPKGASVLILGAGLAGMTAALELRKAGYNVRILEFNSRAGGRNWTLRGGDSFTELGGFRQTCEFKEGLYINPGPWRIPYHHRALLDYCKRLGVVLEPFIQLNHNALLHTTRAFGGAPQRIRDIKTDFQGQISELLAKATQQGRLDEAVSKEDREILMQALRSWGALDGNYAYKANLISADFRGYAKDPGGGVGAAPIAGEPINLSDILKSRVWRYLQNFALHTFQTTMFQPVGGMDMIGKAFAREVGDVIRYEAKVTAIQQDDHGVTVTYTDLKAPATPQQAKADWCVCTIPLSILDLRRHQLHRPADPSDRLSQHRLQQLGQGCAAGRVSFRRSQRLRIHRDVASRADRAGCRIRRQHSSAIPRRIREWRCRCLAPHAVYVGLRRQLDRQGKGGALRRSLPDRRQDRVGGRACILHSGMAGGRHSVVSQRHHPAA